MMASGVELSPMASESPLLRLSTSGTCIVRKKELARNPIDWESVS